ncbi:hypothetical protein DPX16_2822 [Anabarilius grahami]|uniref:Uncharacterized protein n=1 Tax=Anabarilius grahami TaxID=495550 RepID=A0A3N0YX77_ANAGA|nr:hypothetical protein DPX16_2822 [Anabarilius grahami]
MLRHGCGTCRTPLQQDDGHGECVFCLGKPHAEALLIGTSCSHCENMSLASLCSRIALFSESSPAAHALLFSSSQEPVRKKQRGKGAQRLHTNLRPSAEASDMVSFGGSEDEPLDDSMSLAASETEEWGGDSEDPTPLPSVEPIDARSGMDAELFRVLSRAVEELNLEWVPPEKPTHSHLDEWFLPNHRQPPPLTSVDGSQEKGYEQMPPLDEAVAAHLCPPATVGWKNKRALSSKPCRTTSALTGRAYSSAGQAASALHTMAILQVFQAKLLRSLD